MSGVACLHSTYETSFQGRLTASSFTQNLHFLDGTGTAYMVRLMLERSKILAQRVAAQLAYSSNNSNLAGKRQSPLGADGGLHAIHLHTHFALEGWSPTFHLAWGTRK